MKNVLSAATRRRVSDCNHNQHYNFIHPDRTMAEHDLLYLMEGVWEVIVDQTPHLLHAGDMLLLPAGVHHYGRRRSEGAVRVMYLHFNADPADRRTDEVPSGEGYQFDAVVHCAENPHIKALFFQIVTEFWAAESGNETRISAYMDLLLRALESQSQNRTPHSRYLFSVLTALRSAPERFFTIEELARLAHVSPKTLTAAFRRLTGETVHQYQMREKLTAARAMLDANPTITLRELADTFGFCDEYHFSKAYKAHYLHSPKQTNGAAQ